MPHASHATVTEPVPVRLVGRLPDSTRGTAQRHWGLETEPSGGDRCGHQRAGQDLSCWPRSTWYRSDTFRKSGARRHSPAPELRKRWRIANRSAAPQAVSTHRNGPRRCNGLSARTVALSRHGNSWAQALHQPDNCGSVATGPTVRSRVASTDPKTAIPRSSPRTRPAPPPNPPGSPVPPTGCRGRRYSGRGTGAARYSATRKSVPPSRPA